MSRVISFTMNGYNSISFATNVLLEHRNFLRDGHILPMAALPHPNLFELIGRGHPLKCPSRRRSETCQRIVKVVKAVYLTTCRKIIFLNGSTAICVRGDPADGGGVFITPPIAITSFLVGGAPGSLGRCNSITAKGASGVAFCCDAIRR
jgi:hypothetical protein